MSAPASIAFAGTPEFAVPSLHALVACGVTVPVVLTQPDRPAGRGRRLTASPAKEAALSLGLAVAQPASLRSPSLAEVLGPRPDLMIVIAYGLLLPRAMRRPRPQVEARSAQSPQFWPQQASPAVAPLAAAPAGALERPL